MLDAFSQGMSQVTARAEVSARIAANPVTRSTLAGQLERKVGIAGEVADLPEAQDVVMVKEEVFRNTLDEDMARRIANFNQDRVSQHMVNVTRDVTSVANQGTTLEIARNR